MVKNRLVWFAFIFGVFISTFSMSQTIPAGFPLLEEDLRRQQLLGSEITKDLSFSLRPVLSLQQNRFASHDSLPLKKNVQFGLLPILSTSVYNSNRPFGWGNYSLMNGAGFQTLLSPGVYGKLLFLKFQFRPEFVASQNKSYNGFSSENTDNILFGRFRYWNFGDSPERFTEDYNSFVWWGQSFISLNAGPIELGFGTQNIWWGPGQFNSLIFSNNARGIKHAFFRTSRPADILFGKLESEIIVGRAEDSGILPSQNSLLNSIFARPFSDDWRYITGINLTFQPNFIPGLFLGFSRTFQQYNENVGDSFNDKFPIFEAFQKKKFLVNDNSVIYDGKGQDQQVALSIRYFNSNANFEIYAEYGKRDHSYNWREFILNPEHARAYLLGFSKIVKTQKQKEYYQIRAEIVHQQESVNRYIRYEFLNSFNASWHTHYQARGFANEGLPMGVGIGTGANAQIFEFSKITGLNKMGLLFQRIVNNQDFFYGTLAVDPNKRPWVDFSAGLLLDHQWNKLLLSNKLLLNRAVNYQWEESSDSTKDFPNGKSLWTFSSTFHIIYQLNN
ncbi:hypothetical protein JYB64_11620 [Algoriphagus aestuarii]|nr:hypothetical protein [Algoriphagus aestuarii]